MRKKIRMGDHSASYPPADPAAYERFQQWMRLMGRAQQLLLEHWAGHAGATRPLPPDPFGLMPLGAKVLAGLTADAEALAGRNAALMRRLTALWTQAEAEAEAGKPDRRFAAPEWQSHMVFDLARQSYLLASEHWLAAVDDAAGLTPQERERARFFARQLVDALSPANFPLTNPQVLKATLQEQGENLLRGFENLLKDLEKGYISLTDESAFAVGENVATTPGKVVFENDLFQLIQYAPATETVREVPIVIAPPWINKFYILDLTPEKSFVRWCVAQGLTVFVISWVNPGSEHRNTGLGDYMQRGLITAMETAREMTGAPSVHAIGYCVAGSLLAPTLAWLEANGRGRLVSSATFFTTQVDFEDAGELRLLIDRAQLDTLNLLCAESGYLDSRYMAATFNLLRANDLIWNYVVNNYLLGREPPPFDLLYWNSDSTRLPHAMLREYLEGMYLENRLATPDALHLDRTPIDLARVNIPTYIQAGRDDHIAPPNSVYKLTRHFTGPTRFVLANSGHIAGVVNPPSANKYGYRAGDILPETLEEFTQTTPQQPGSWWPDWLEWLTPLTGNTVPARTPGTHPNFPALEDAPGRYVRVR